MKNKLVYLIIIVTLTFCFINVKAENINVELNYNDSSRIVKLLENENNSGDSDTDCNVLGEFGKDLQSIFNVFKIVAPILTLVLSTYDFVVSITSKSAEGLQKSSKKFVTRLVLVVLLYLLPTLINLLLQLTIGGSTCVGKE